jgi:hypothetical protein
MMKKNQMRYLKFGRTDSMPFSSNQAGRGGRVKVFSAEECSKLQTQMKSRVKKKDGFFS